MEVSHKIGEWLLGAFQYIFQEKAFEIYGQILQFLSAFIVNEKAIDKFPFVYQITGYIAAVVNASLLMIILWYALKRMFSYTGFETENPMMFISKLIFYGILANFGFYITKYLVWIFSLITNIVASIQPSFSIYNIKDTLARFVPQNASQLLSIEGIIQILTIFFVIKLCFTFSIRYILVVFVITPLSPLALISNLSQSMSGIFKGWLKLLISLMASQIVQVLLLVCIISLKNYLGTALPKLQTEFYILCMFWLMTKVDIYTKDVVEGLGVYNNLSSGLAGIRNSIISTQQAKTGVVR